MVCSYITNNLIIISKTCILVVIKYINDKQLNFKTLYTQKSK